MTDAGANVQVALAGRVRFFGANAWGIVTSISSIGSATISNTSPDLTRKPLDEVMVVVGEEPG